MRNSQQDIWSKWLLNRRFGGDPERMNYMLDYLYPVRDKVLSRINLDGGGTLLDVGSGDGLIAFGALEEFETCRVIFSDISEDLLHHAHTLARNMDVQQRCEFVRAAADDLNVFDNESVEAVTTRSVLIYVSAKQQAFKEFYRVLKPEGQLSIFEPINRFAYPEPSDQFAGYNVAPIAELAQKLKAVYRRIQPPDTDPMTDFDERDHLFVHRDAHAARKAVEPLEGRHRPRVRADEIVAERVQLPGRDPRRHAGLDLTQQAADDRPATGDEIDLLRGLEVDHFTRASIARPVVASRMLCCTSLTGWSASIRRTGACPPS